ncbi:MAG: hypothetical protein WC484_07860 [Candidatus Omnitrophota bacterium]
MVGLTTLAVFPDAKHYSLKNYMAVRTPIPDKQFSGIILGLETGNERCRPSTLYTAHPFDLPRVPKPLRHFAKNMAAARIGASYQAKAVAQSLFYPERACSHNAISTSLSLGYEYQSLSNFNASIKFS